MHKRIVYRTIFLLLTILVIPLVPIIIIFLGVSSPEYVIKGTLNIDLSQSVSPSYWNIYLNFLSRIIRLDFGESISSGQLVIRVISSGILESFKIILPAIIISYLLGTVIGVLISKYKTPALLWNKTQFLFYIPIIVIAYLLLYFLDFMGVDFLSNIKYLAASAVLSVYPIYVITNAVKKTLRELSDSDFFLYHQAFGFSLSEIWKKFCYRFVIIDYLSFFENIIIFMIGFIFFAEAPFGIHGMGYKFIIAIQRFDYPVIIGFCIFGIILLSVVGLVVEIIKANFDPREANV